MSILFTSARAEKAAAQVREVGPTATLKLKEGGHEVSAEQLDTVARIIREARPSVCNGVESEAPGFVEPRHQSDPELLRLDIGILTGPTFWIDRAGEIVRSTEEVLDGPLTFCVPCGVEKRMCDDRRHRRTVEVPTGLLVELRKNYTEDGVRQWLRGANGHFGGRRALDLIAAGETERVLQTAAVLTDGAFL